MNAQTSLPALRHRGAGTRRQSARDLGTSAPFRIGHRGAGTRYVATTRAATLARRTLAQLLALTVIGVALALLGLVGHEDVRGECRDAMATDVVSTVHTDTVNTCRDLFGSRGY